MGWGWKRGRRVSHGSRWLWPSPCLWDRGGIWDRLGDIVTPPVALAPWWMGSGAIYPLSLLSSPCWGRSHCPLPWCWPRWGGCWHEAMARWPKGCRVAVPCHAVPCHAARPAEAAGAGGLPPPSFPQASSRRSFPDDLIGCTFLNCLADCFIIRGQLKRRRVPVAPLRTPSLPEPQNKGRNWAWARPAWIPI